ncbi:LegC family aminotransferase [Alteromonas gilva]|uniref:LegC family aminotransferase n=1 Tax=Alteromonas gilva TaxID=2987522 RepID=A0ABT5L0R5_9ALTE|nr:LegC family aminotransferase [Alteromonas gilva]MDC8830473.1 LegC family aminotransferase [Alteromonas gilva]
MNALVDFVRSIYNRNDFIALHEPRFSSQEHRFLHDVVDSTFVSSVGKYVDQFEDDIMRYTGANGAVAVVNGTAALHTCLHALDIANGDLVLTQAVSFVATANAVKMAGAEPVFIDIARDSLSLCPDALKEFLTNQTSLTQDGQCIHNSTRKLVKAILVVHTFGHPARLNELLEVAKTWNIPLVEDAAESFGSFYEDQHTGTFGHYGAISFNGNKIITTGGGGMILTKSSKTARQIKHITTTAKVSHPYEYYHDEFGFNYRMPNLNAALGCAQFASFENVLQQKRELADKYQAFFSGTDYEFVTEPSYARSNYWLNAVICHDAAAKVSLLESTNKQGIMTRPLWQLLNSLPMYKRSISTDLTNSEWLAARCVCLPSGTFKEVE